MKVIQLTTIDIEDILNNESDRFYIVGNCPNLDEGGDSCEVYVKDRTTEEYYCIDIYRRGYQNLICTFSTTLTQVTVVDPYWS